MWRDGNWNHEEIILKLYPMSHGGQCASSSLSCASVALIWVGLQVIGSAQICVVHLSFTGPNSLPGAWTEVSNSSTPLQSVCVMPTNILLAKTSHMVNFKPWREEINSSYQWRREETLGGNNPNSPKELGHLKKWFTRDWREGSFMEEGGRVYWDSVRHRGCGLPLLGCVKKCHLRATISNSPCSWEAENGSE